MKKIVLLSFASAFATSIQAQGPEVTSWIIDPVATPGYAGITTNVQMVQYSASNVYVSATCIPGYDIGPWAGSPNVPSNQNFVYKITRNPVQNTGTLINTPLGHIGVWRNGVSIFNAKDAMSYMNMGVWNQNAIVVEGSSFDDCMGHPAPNGEYHHHLNPVCLYDMTDSVNHSPIIGYAFDGFPVYGAWGFANTDGTGGITRMKSSYRKRTMSTRTTLPDGSTASSAGPPVSGTYPLGYYIEDFEFISGLGDLDVHNGRFCVTPEYPAGIYAYFVTIDAGYEAAYPYTLGLQYYGTVQPGNTGPMSGHNTPSESVVTWTATGVPESAEPDEISFYPNPVKDLLNIHFKTESASDVYISILDPLGRIVVENTLITANTDQRIDLSGLSGGVYFLRIQGSDGFEPQRLIIAH